MCALLNCINFMSLRALPRRSAFVVVSVSCHTVALAVMEQPKRRSSGHIRSAA
jgi:hypothetical protein